MPTAEEVQAQALFPELAPQWALQALRLNQARDQARPQVAIPGENPAVAAAPRPVGPPMPAPPQPQAILPPAPGVVDAASIPPNAMQSTGPGGPNVGLPPAGQRVEQDPNWRRAWDVGRERDAANAQIQALGGPVYGSPGATPSLSQFLRSNPTATPQDYAHLLTAGSGAQTATGQLDINRMNAETNRLGVGRGPDQLAADNAARALYLDQLKASRDKHPERSEEQHHAYASSSSGVPTDRFLQLISATPLRGPGSAPPAGPPLPDSVRTAPRGVGPPVNARGISTEPGTAGGRPWAEISTQLHAASGYQPAVAASGTTPATPERKPTIKIGEFINNLENSSPGTLAQNYPAIRNYIEQMWGGQALRSADRAASSPAQMQLGFTGGQGESILGALGGRISGNPSDNATGLSILGNLHQAINQAGGSHAEFLRRQRGGPPLGPPIP